MSFTEMWALKFKFGESVDWQQLDFFDEPPLAWFGPMFWPSNETDPKKVKEEFYNSLPKRKLVCVIEGKYEKKGEKWQLTPLQ